MAALRWDEQAQAYVESTNVPMRYDVESGAWVETTGMAYNPDVGAWEEKWNTGVKAYVYGAALETVTIKKDGIIVATVDTDSTGQSTEQITLSKGTYTLAGSVSGWTEEQTVDENTEKLRAMPEGALYWYGNECTDVTGGWEWIHSGYTYGNASFVQKGSYNVFTKNSDNFKCTSYGIYSTLISPKNKIDFSMYTKIHVSALGITGEGSEPAIIVTNRTNLSSGIFNVHCESQKGSYSDTYFDISSVVDFAKIFLLAYSERAYQMRNIWLEK